MNMTREAIEAELDRAMELWQRRLTTFAAVLYLLKELERCNG